MLRQRQRFNDPGASSSRIEKRHIVVVSEEIEPREPSLRILRLVNEVPATFRGSGSLPTHAGERQISIASSSFPTDIIYQIKELLLDDFDLHVSHSRSGKPIKKVNQRVNRFHAISMVSDTRHKMRVCLQGVASYQLTQFPKHLWNASLHIFKLRIGLMDL